MKGGSNFVHSYLINAESNIEIEENFSIPRRKIVEAIQLTNHKITELSSRLSSLNINLFETLGLRNLSGTVGEIFVQSISDVTKSKVIKNPHQDGYPDLLRKDTSFHEEYFHSCVDIKNDKIYPKDKELFSPYKYGAFEIKATCGETPPAKKIPKPLVGEQRIQILTKFDWKAHHRETTKLMSLVWDFIDETPIIVAVFFRTDLTEEDWGKIISPKEGKGRTTSVSIMTRNGVKKMCENWIALLDDDIYIERFSKFIDLPL